MIGLHRKISILTSRISACGSIASAEADRAGRYGFHGGACAGYSANRIREKCYGCVQQMRSCSREASDP